MPQDDALYEDVTAEENLRFFAALYGVKGEHLARRMDELFAFVRLQRHRKKLVHDYSGGMKRRLSLAVALVHEPAVLVLDEPTAMLDPAGRADVLATVRKLNREQGMTVIWITHFMEEAAVADRVVVLDKGKIALDGTPAEVFSQVQKVKALGLDVPPMAELAMRLRAGGLSLPDGILTVADMVKELKKALCPSK